MRYYTEHKYLLASLEDGMRVTVKIGRARFVGFVVRALAQGVWVACDGFALFSAYRDVRPK